MLDMIRILQKNIKVVVVLTLLVIGGLFLGFHLKKITHKPVETKISNPLRANNKVVIKDDQEIQELKIYDSWTHYTINDGLPSNKINTVRAIGNTVWIGTDKGLALMEDGKIIDLYNSEDSSEIINYIIKNNVSRT